MVRTLCYSLAPALALLLGGAGAASAQPSASPPGAAPPPVYAAPPPPMTAHVPIVVRAEPRFLRWGVGVHLGGMGVSPEQDGEVDEASKVDLGLVGAQLRFRLHRRWELELDLTYMEGDLPGAGATRRSTGAVILGGMFHINPDHRWLWSVLLGVGGTRDRVWYEKQGERVTQAEFAGGLARIGIGLERRFDRLGVAAQLFGVGLERNDDELDGPDYVDRDGPVPQKSSGGLFQLVANYYF
jgi:hypothetical protein